MNKVAPSQPGFNIDPKLIGPCTKQNPIPEDLNKILNQAEPLHFLSLFFTALIYGSIYMLIQETSNQARQIGAVIFCLSAVVYFFEARHYYINHLNKIDSNMIPISKFRHNILKPPLIQYELETYIYKKRSSSRKTHLEKIKYSECKDMSIIPALNEEKFTIIKIMNSRLIYWDSSSLKKFANIKKKIMDASKLPTGTIEERIKIETSLVDLFIVTPEEEVKLPSWLGCGWYFIMSFFTLTWFYRMFLRFMLDQRMILIQKRIRISETA